MSDEPHDPYAAVDAAYEERVRQWREQAMAKWRAREGLVRLNERPMALAFEAFKRSLPSFQDAERLFELVEAGLGERGVRDAWSTPAERCLLVRDPERPEWFLPQRLLYLHTEYRENPPIPMHLEVPERIKRIMARKKAKEPPPEEVPEEVVVPLSPGGRPGRLCIYEGAAHADIKFGDRGQFKEWTVSTGDTFAFSQADVEPFTLDPQARPKQTPPLSLLLRDAELGDGAPVDVLARLVLELRPELADRGRVHLPAVQPGTATGAWTRGLWNLRAAEWEGRVPDEDGWVVIDAWNGTAIATGPTLDAAFAAWREQVRRVQPLPPVERQATPAVEEPEPASPADPPKVPENVAVASMGTIRIEIHPPVIMQWPEPRPENVPAVAVPLAALPRVPEELAAVGFSRAVRFFGEQGEYAFGFVRDEDGGFTLVGDDTVGVLDVERLEDEIARVDAAVREGWYDPFGHGDPWEKPRYPVRVQGYRVWDDTGREPEFREGGIGWQAQLAPRGWGVGQRHVVTRVTYLQVKGKE
ncbi:MAG: hypothetical protein ACOZNI_09045 [Myxococcota bacterium]